MTPAQNLPSMRAALKSAKEGCGEVERIIELAEFSIGERGFTTLIVTCGRMGSPKKAIEIFRAMSVRSIRPNSYTYGAIISVCCSASQCDLALKYYEEMRAAAAEDASCKPDARVYKNLVPTCLQHAKFDIVLALFEEISSAGIEADKLTLESVLEASWRRRRWDVAARVLDDSHARDQILSPRAYTKLLGACADHGDLDQGLEFFITMQMAGVPANTYSCRGLMRAIESGGRADMGIGLVNQMLESKIFVSNETYNCLLRVVSKCGLWNELISIVTEMRQLGIAITVESRAVIMQCHNAQLGASDTSTASFVASKMKGLGIAIDSDAQGWSIGAGYRLSNRASSSGGLSS
ncbi:hypothetical protein BSKO_09359 [Bryopsis sp. KO-2023]|nr:hypothetical protein BSKO_09359 [Bryopsis sp. KO-2023]